MGMNGYCGRPTSPNLHNPFSPSLISPVVSVDIEHHVYLYLETNIHCAVPLVRDNVQQTLLFTEAEMNKTATCDTDVTSDT